MMLAMGVLVGLLVGAGPAPRTPVIVELFSSEGCSSCPDADAVLAELDTAQPVDGAQVIALELHVDYWNHLGWADPFSRPEYTERQSRYAPHFDRMGVYTPQMVVDGAVEFVGSESRTARAAIAAAAARPHPAHIVQQRAGRVVTIDVSQAPSGADVVVMVTEQGLSTRVDRGENAGRTLRHGPVVRTIHSLGSVGADGHFEGSVPIEPSASRRQVVIVQERETLHIAGAAAITVD